MPIGNGNTMEWRGPFEIILKLSDVFYKVNINNKEKIVHLNNLRTYEENKVFENKSEDDLIIENKSEDDINKSEHAKMTLNKCCSILKSYNRENKSKIIEIENKPDNDISKSEHRKITLRKCCEILRNFSRELRYNQ